MAIFPVILLLSSLGLDVLLTSILRCFFLSVGQALCSVTNGMDLIMLDPPTDLRNTWPLLERAPCSTHSSQIIATSDEDTPKGGDCKGNPLISGKSRLVNKLF